MSNKENFIEAVKNDEYCEWEIAEDLFLVTDHEFDGSFLPYIVDPENQYSGEEVEEILGDSEVSEVFEWYDLDETEDEYYPVVEYCEYETVDNSVWE